MTESEELNEYVELLKEKIKLLEEGKGLMRRESELREAILRKGGEI